MQLACCSNGTTSITQPAAGPDDVGGAGVSLEGQHLSGVESGFRAHEARNPNVGEPVDNSHQKHSFRAHEIPSIALGEPRPVGTQAGGVNYVRVFDGAVGWTHEHMLYQAGASQAQGHQTPLERVQANTWRSAPMPWDTNLYVGAVPERMPMADG